MAPHTSVLAWGVLWTEEPGGLQATGLGGVTKQSDTTERKLNNDISYK